MTTKPFWKTMKKPFFKMLILATLILLVAWFNFGDSQLSKELKSYETEYNRECSIIGMKIWGEVDRAQHNNDFKEIWGPQRLEEIKKLKAAQIKNSIALIDCYNKKSCGRLTIPNG